MVKSVCGHTIRYSCQTKSFSIFPLYVRMRLFLNERCDSQCVRILLICSTSYHIGSPSFDHVPNISILYFIDSFNRFCRHLSLVPLTILNTQYICVHVHIQHSISNSRNENSLSSNSARLFHCLKKIKCISSFDTVETKRQYCCYTLTLHKTIKSDKHWKMSKRRRIDDARYG